MPQLWSSIKNRKPSDPLLSNKSVIKYYNIYIFRSDLPENLISILRWWYCLHEGHVKLRLTVVCTHISFHEEGGILFIISYKWLSSWQIYGWGVYYFVQRTSLWKQLKYGTWPTSICIPLLYRILFFVHLYPCTALMPMEVTILAFK